jgi:hypothetical protein
LTWVKAALGKGMTIFVFAVGAPVFVVVDVVVAVFIRKVACVTK